MSYALACEFCFFDTPLSLGEATTRSVHLTDSRLAGFDGTRMRVEGVLDLSRSHIEAVLRIDRATINADMLLREAVIGAPGGEDGVAARGLTVEGELNAGQLLSYGPVRLSDARISGSVLLSRQRDDRRRAVTGIQRHQFGDRRGIQRPRDDRDRRDPPASHSYRRKPESRRGTAEEPRRYRSGCRHVVSVFAWPHRGQGYVVICSRLVHCSG
jgi:hypothetical protein